MKRRVYLTVEELENRWAPATLIVNTIADTNARDASLTLREAIMLTDGTLTVANLTAQEKAQVVGAPSGKTPDTIQFSIAPGAQVISVLGAGLPAITHPVIIDGTAPNAFPTQTIRIDGANANNAGVNGLTLTSTASDSQIKNLSVTGFSGNGIELDGGGGDKLTGLFIGTDSTGKTGIGNKGAGILIDGSSKDTIGGANAASRNVISGNDVGVQVTSAYTGVNVKGFKLFDVIIGNYIGVGPNGSSPIPNRNGIVLASAPYVTIGGTNPGEGNVISGNRNDGILVTNKEDSAGSSPDYAILGNTIGLTAALTRVNAKNNNGLAGIEVLAGTGKIVGNTVSGNSRFGLRLDGDASSAQRIYGNYIGTTSASALGLGNSSGLAIVNSSNNQVGGADAAQANVIAGNVENVQILGEDAQDNVVEGNYIGVNKQNVILPNQKTDDDGDTTTNLSLFGVNISGTNNSVLNNVIGGNRAGIQIDNGDGNTIAGNFIGQDKTGKPLKSAGPPTTMLWGNTIGVVVEGQAINNKIGEAGLNQNMISGNGRGVLVSNAGLGNSIANNQIQRGILVKNTSGLLINANIISYGATGIRIQDDGLGVTNNIKVSNNVIFGYNVSGIKIIGATDVDVSDNKIGIDPMGKGAGGRTGISVAGNSSSITIGLANVISDNTVGILVDGLGQKTGNANVSITGNFIGTSADGLTAIGNTEDGIRIVSSKGVDIGAANVPNIIAGNGGNGIAVIGTAALPSNKINILNNKIGTDSAGAALPNAGNGIFIGKNAGVIRIKENAIAYNGKAGVALVNDPTLRVLIADPNLIWDNGTLGIDLGDDGPIANHIGLVPGPNNWQNYPVVSSAVVDGSATDISGTLNSLPNSTYTLEFFGNDNGTNAEGQYYLGTGTVTTDDDGNATFSFSFPTIAGTYITATATGCYGTSDFSAPYQLTVSGAPVGTANTVTVNENASYVFSAADFGFTDPENSPPNNFVAVKITTLPGAGTLTDNGVAVSAGAFVSVSDINNGLLVYTPAADESGSPFTSFAFQVEDDGSTADGNSSLDPSPRTMTIDVTGVNQAPIGTDNTVTTLENTNYTFSTADFGFSDPNDNPANNFLAVDITTLPTVGTLTDGGVDVSAGQYVSVSDINAGLLVYTPLTDTGGSPYGSFTFQVEDDGGTANGGANLDPSPKTMTIDVTRVNQAPVGTSNTVTTLENSAYTFSTADFGFSDPNNSPSDRFRAVEITTLPAVGILTDDGVPVSAGQYVNVSDINAGLLVYTPAANTNGSPHDSFTFQVEESGGTANGGANTDPSPKTMTIDVQPAATITWAAPADIRYGTALGSTQLDASANVAGTFNYTLTDDTTEANGVLLSAGPDQTLNVSFTPTDSAEYAPVSASVAINVIPAAPSVNVADSGGTYNGSAFSATATVNGGASLEGVTPTLTYYTGTSAFGSSSSSPPTSVGTYTVVANFPGSTDYSSASSQATFTISDATATVSVTDNGGTYNGMSFPATATVNGGASLEGVTPTLTYYTGTSAFGSSLSSPPSAVGAYTVVATFPGSTDYSSASSQAMFTISGAVLTTPIVSVTDNGGTYNGMSFPATATANGETSLEGVYPTLTYYTGTSAFGSSSSSPPSAVGTYTVVATFPGSTDYSSASSQAMFTISGAVLTTPIVSVTDNGGTYNGMSFPATATVNGGASLEGVTPTLSYYTGSSAFGSSSSSPPAAVGTYTVVATFPGSTDYSSASSQATFTISGAVLTTPIVSVTDNGGTYNGMSFPATATVNGGASLEGVTPTLTYYTGTSAFGSSSSSPPSAAGTYTVVATFPGSTDYSSASSQATFTINGAVLTTPTVNVTDNGGTYNGMSFPATATVDGGASLEGVTPTLTYYTGASAFGSSSSSPPTAVGTYTVVATFPGSTDYRSASSQATFTISGAVLTTPTVNVTDNGGTYNGMSFPATATVDGGASLEGVTPTLTYYTGASAFGSSSSSPPTAVGTYTVVATFPGSTDYRSASSQATFMIRDATPAVSVTDNGGTFNGMSFPATATVNGGASLEGVTPTLTYYTGTSAFGSSSSSPPTAVGTYTVVATFSGSTDFNSASSQETFTIN